MEQTTVEEIYAMGELDVNNLGRLREKFTIFCAHCGSKDIAFKVESDDGGYCDTCSSPYARCTIKCKECGQAVSIR